MNCPKCGGPTWDNRPKKAAGTFSAKSPDFKCKDKTCDGVIWPDKEAKPAVKVARINGGAKWTWAQLSSLYGRSLAVAKKHLVAQRGDFDIGGADLVAAAATIFIAASRDGVAEPTTAPAPQPLTEKPKALAEDDDLPF